MSLPSQFLESELLKLSTRWQLVLEAGRRESSGENPPGRLLWPSAHGSNSPAFVECNPARSDSAPDASRRIVAASYYPLIDIYYDIVRMATEIFRST